MKRAVSQALEVYQEAVKRPRRRCSVEDCPHTPLESKAKCAECSATLCSRPMCVNPRKIVGKRTMARCADHSQSKPSRRAATVTHSVTESFSVTEIKQQEAAHETKREQAEIVRCYTPKGVLDRETERRTTETVTQTVRERISSCAERWTKDEFTRLSAGDKDTALPVAAPAIRMACMEKDNVFVDAENHKGSFHSVVMQAVKELRELHDGALEGIPRGTLVPCELLQMLSQSKSALLKACEGKETHPLFSMYSSAHHAWSSLMAMAADFFPRFGQEFAVNRVFPEGPHYYQHINDLIGTQPEEADDKPKAKHRNGLPLPSDTPDWLCGLSRLHFIELGIAVGVNGTEVFRALSLVQNLHKSDEILFSLVASSQVTVRCAHDPSLFSLQEDARAGCVEFLKILSDPGPLALFNYASPCISLHRGISDHTESAVRIKMKIINPMPLTKDDQKKNCIEFNVYLPHQFMELFISALDKDKFMLCNYQNARRKMISGKIRSAWADLKADTKRFMFGIPLHETLLKHPAFQPMLELTSNV
jgi:hypothetical protein